MASVSMMYQKVYGKHLHFRASDGVFYYSVIIKNMIYDLLLLMLDVGEIKSWGGNI